MTTQCDLKWKLACITWIYELIIISLCDRYSPRILKLFQHGKLTCFDESWWKLSTNKVNAFTKTICVKCNSENSKKLFLCTKRLFEQCFNFVNILVEFVCKDFLYYRIEKYNFKLVSKIIFHIFIKILSLQLYYRENCYD